MRQVRARGASKGNFVHMVMDRLGWQPECTTFPDDDDGAGDQNGSSARVAKTDAPGGRFCLCVGDDVSDEDMFIAAKVRLPATSTAVTQTLCSVAQAP